MAALGDCGVRVSRIRTSPLMRSSSPNGGQLQVAAFSLEMARVL
ncbi:hypothetical protein [Amycolatopsis speibonae]|uniref:Uncharacterized protein n=1 Tax=Amycolatopsis speibonae TaxID=1450224 RepID=A0ABV7P8H1_9PSEU